MVKDYFQDILPPQGGSAPKATPPQPPASNQSTNEVASEPEPAYESEPTPGTRSIRNITVTSRAPRRTMPDDVHEAPTLLQSPMRHMRKRWWIWLVAVVSVLILGLLIAVSMRPTTVRVIPRSHAVVFDSSMKFTAYPTERAATGTLPYIINTLTLEDSAVVPAEGSERVEEKAMGTVTVVNNYSTAPVKLIKNTRFETPDGLIFRISADVSVPGKSGTKPGELSVQVTADAAGEKYNVGPVARFTLPGLKSSPDMYPNVYARSAKAMSGGFVGERPVIASAALAAAKAAIRDRIEEQVRAAAQNQTNPAFVVLPDLIHINYTSLPSTKEEGTNVRIHESASVEIPAFPADLFAQTVARGVSADAEGDSVMLKGIDTLTARFAGSNTSPVLGNESLEFTLEGSATLVWNVDLQTLAEALAGREDASFKAIVAAFPGIDEAYARFQPFWKNSFPKDPADIQIRLEEIQPPGN